MHNRVSEQPSPLKSLLCIQSVVLVGISRMYTTLAPVAHKVNADRMRFLEHGLPIPPRGEEKNQKAKSIPSPPFLSDRRQAPTDPPVISAIRTSTEKTKKTKQVVFSNSP